MITGARVGNYIVEIDEAGDEVLSFDEQAAWRLPKNYREREVALMVENLRWGHRRPDLAVSRKTFHATVQHVRGRTDWGAKFKKDPRPFSSVRESPCHSPT